jgi:shikimate kinase
MGKKLREWENIVLLGSKHCGKTSAGAELAEVLQREFIDLDNLIEKQTGKTPRALYKEGAAVFKNAEINALNAALEEGERRGKNIIAPGGGIIDNEPAVFILENFKKERKAALVCLAVSAQTAWERIRAGGELPPFLLEKADSPEETHRILHTRRQNAYQRLAGFIVQAEGKSVGETADLILKELEGKNENKIDGF